MKVDVIGPENILFAGASVHLSAYKFYRHGAVKGLRAWNRLNAETEEQPNYTNFEKQSHYINFKSSTQDPKSKKTTVISCK